MHYPATPAPTTPGITGYRDLTQAEKDLMNQIKAHANLTKLLIDKIEALQMAAYETKLKAPPHELDSTARVDAINMNIEAQRWRTMARDDLQLGFMELTRSVALPTSF